jgi:chromosome segregation ATPase
MAWTSCCWMQECDSLQSKFKSAQASGSATSQQLEATKRELAAVQKRAHDLQALLGKANDELQASKLQCSQLDNTIIETRAALEAERAEQRTENKAWKGERAQLVSDRDGYAAQVATLRDKVSELSRQCADGADGAEAREARLAALEGIVRDGEAALEQERAGHRELQVEVLRERAAMKGERAQWAEQRSGLEAELETMRAKVRNLLPQCAGPCCPVGTDSIKAHSHAVLHCSRARGRAPAK